MRLAEEAGLPLPESVRQADVLTPFAIETRYPGYWEEIREEEEAEALRIAEQVVEWARRMIQETPAGKE